VHVCHEQLQIRIVHSRSDGHRATATLHQSTHSASAALCSDSAAINKNEMVLGIELLDCDEEDDEEDLSAPATTTAGTTTAGFQRGNALTTAPVVTTTTNNNIHNIHHHHHIHHQRCVASHPYHPQRILSSSLPHNICSPHHDHNSSPVVTSAFSQSSRGVATHYCHQNCYNVGVPSSSASVRANTSVLLAGHDDPHLITTRGGPGNLQHSTTTHDSSSTAIDAESSTCSNMFSNSLGQEMQGNLSAKPTTTKRAVFASSLPSFPNTFALMQFDSPAHARMTSADLFGLRKKHNNNSQGSDSAADEQAIMSLLLSRSNNGTPGTTDGHQLRKSHNPYRGVQVAPATYLIA
jgi:hypothetical protein